MEEDSLNLGGAKGIRQKRSKGYQPVFDEESISILNQIKIKNNQNNNNQYYFKKEEWRRSGNLYFV